MIDPNDHPANIESVESHEDHIEQYAEILSNADPEEVKGVMVVLTGKYDTETLPTVSDDVDARSASLWMLGAHIHHVTTSAKNADMEQVSHDAIGYLRENGFQE